MTGLQIQKSGAPTNKAVAATGGSAFGAAITTLVIHSLPGCIDYSPEVKAALATIVTALITGLAAYFTPPGAAEAVFRAIDGTPISGKVVQPPADSG